MQKRCEASNGYCGGTWAGTKKMLPYVQQLGFDALWMSPFMQQGPDNMGSAGYHGVCGRRCAGGRGVVVAGSRSCHRAAGTTAVAGAVRSTRGAGNKQRPQQR
jgi:hypothetical protein